MSNFKVVPSKPEFSVNENGDIMFTSTGTILKPYTDKDGYKRVKNFSAGGKSHYISVSRAVAEVFVENPDPENFDLVNHLDNDKANNHKSNLEWTNHSHNRTHATHARGPESSRNNVKLSEEVVVEICEMLTLGLRIVDISEKTGVSRFNIMAIRDGRSWNHITVNYPCLKTKRRDTLSKKTLLWIKDQLGRGRSKEDILLMSVRLTEEEYERALKILSLI